MSRYGLNLRAQPKKQPTRPPLPKPVGFGDDDDNDNDVEREISRHATKNKSLRDIEEQQRKALEQDPSAFDYDGVYDDMKQKAIQPRAQDQKEKKPRYIQHLMKKAEERTREQEIVFERKLAKERSQEDHLYGDKDKFVTKAYKKKLAEQAKWMEEDRLRQLREEQDDVTKKTDLSDFYFNLEKNVAFGADDAKSRKLAKQAEISRREKEAEISRREKEAEISRREKEAEISRREKEAEISRREKEAEPSRQEKQDELREPQKLEEETSVPLESPKAREGHVVENITLPASVEPSDEKAPLSTSAGETVSAEQPPVDLPIANHHKRSHDAVAAAKERFLARKRAKDEQKYYEN